MSSAPPKMALSFNLSPYPLSSTHASREAARSGGKGATASPLAPRLGGSVVEETSREEPPPAADELPPALEA